MSDTYVGGIEKVVVFRVSEFKGMRNRLEFDENGIEGIFP
jgi:hypothetical protein